MSDKRIIRHSAANVLVAGFPRCASTYLAHLIAQHPDVSVSKIKEVNYFNHTHKFLAHPNFRHHRSRNSFRWYKSMFDQKKKIRMDFSIVTSYDLKSPERVKKKLGDIKFLFLVRNKNNHMKSIHDLMTQTGEIRKMSFKKYLEKYDFYAEYYSNFEEHIERYKKTFSNVFVANIVDKDTKKEVFKILKFLELKKHEFDYEVYRNASSERRQADFFQPSKRRLFIYFPQIYTNIKKITDKLSF